MAKTNSNADNANTVLLLRAHENGMEAGRSAQPTPMIVAREDGMKQWIVPDGPCGFAWVTVRPAHSRLAKLMAQIFDGKFGGNAHKDSYNGGMMLWVWEFNQSMVRKEAYARAFAATLRAAGFEKVSSGSRMD